MKKTPAMLFALTILLLSYLVSLISPAQATSQQAYQDYLFQFDTYRQKLSEFEVAKTEYLKFKTLTAEASALEKTKAMLIQRDILLRSYLLILNERLIEDGGLSSSVKEQYRTTIANEAAFLETHAGLVPAIATIDDAVEVSRQLESHYQVLQITERQIITALALGQMAILARQFDTALNDAQNLVFTTGGTFSPQKRETLNRWILQITNKRTLFQQKINAVTTMNTQLTAVDDADLNRKFTQMTQGVAEARQYLLEGAQFLGELKEALKYNN